MDKISNIKFNYTPAFDGLRGVAVLFVIIFHADSSMWLPGGFLGVDVFFVLSGFLITTLLLQEYEKNGVISYKNFYYRRALRLAPALIILLVVFLLYSFLFFKNDMFLKNIVESLIALFYMSNWTRAFEMGLPIWLGHTWSLSIEEQFYIIWPVTLIYLYRRNAPSHLLKIILAVALFVCLWRAFLTFQGSSIHRLFNGLDMRADSLLAGVALAVAFSVVLIKEYALTHKKKIRFLSAVSFLAIIYASFVADYRESYLYYWLFIVIELFVCIIILDILVSGKSLVKYILEFRVLVWVGTISYGLYLWHYPIFRLMKYYGFSSISILMFGTIIAFIVASLSYYFIEKPLLKLKNRYK